MLNDNYEKLLKNGLNSISDFYRKDADIPKQPDDEKFQATGKRSIFNRYAIFFMNDGPSNAENGVPSGTTMNYFDAAGNWKKESFNPDLGVDNLSTANIIKTCSDGKHNGLEYDWSDFLYTKNNNKIPNNHLITLRRFGSPVGDNLYSKIVCPTPDIARAVAWIDGENNKIEELLKFTVGYNWEEKQSSVQVLESTGYGTENNLLSGKAAAWSGRFISAFNNEGEVLRRTDSQVESFDPFQNKENLTFGPLNVIDKMTVKKTGLNFQQDLKVVFEYELKSYDGIDSKIAYLDLLSNLLILSYSRGEFWGGDTRYTGMIRKRSLLGDDALGHLQAGNFSGFLSAGFSNISQKFNNLTNGLGFSLEGLANFGKNMLGNLGNMAIGSALTNIGRPQLQAMQALLTGEPTGEWHLMVGNPLNPMVSIGNLCLEASDFEFSGPLSYNDFPTKLKVTCTLKHGRPRDRSDVTSMFAPHVGRTYYTDPPNSKYYAMNNSSNKSLNYKGDVQNKAKADVERQFNERILTDLSDVKNRFPNHIKGNDTEEKVNWAAQWTT